MTTQNPLFGWEYYKKSAVPPQESREEVARALKTAYYVIKNHVVKSSRCRNCGSKL